MTLFTVLTSITKILADEQLQDLALRFIAWIQSLSPKEQLAVASKFEGAGGFGCSHDTDCPCTPAEFNAIEAVLLDAAQAGEL